MSPSKQANKLPWSVPVALADIPEGGRRYELAADEETRAQVAQLASLRSLPRLQATFDLALLGSDGLRVEGEVSATVGQNCVVTLEPVDNEVKEEINLVFAPPPRTPAADDGGDAGDIAPGEPEPLLGDVIDLGALAVEFLILGIDPYPRKPDAKFEPPPVQEDEASHPFAALAALKNGQGDKE